MHGKLCWTNTETQFTKTAHATFDQHLPWYHSFVCALQTHIPLDTLSMTTIVQPPLSTNPPPQGWLCVKSWIRCCWAEWLVFGVLCSHRGVMQGDTHAWKEDVMFYQSLPCGCQLRDKGLLVVRISSSVQWNDEKKNPRKSHRASK